MGSDSRVAGTEYTEVQGQVVFKAAIIELCRLQKPAPESDRLQLFLAKHPPAVDEPAVVASHRKYIDEVLLQRLGWVALFGQTGS